MKHIIKRDEAVSPVVGVMLMLVVTIIIAAVVSGFAGGLGGNTDKAPQASISAVEIVVNEAYDSDNGNWNQDPVTDKCDDVYFVFEHKGGEGINLNNIEIHIGSLKYAHEKSVITTAKTVNTTAFGDHDDIQSGFSEGWDIYIEGYPDKSTMISPGSKFVLHADYIRDGTGGSMEFKKISWQPDGAEGAFSIDAGDYLTYDIIDKQSQKSISSGQILVRDFGVASS